jgi:ATP-dependent protease ClpP protease subunit
MKLDDYKTLLCSVGFDAKEAESIARLKAMNETKPGRFAFNETAEEAVIEMYGAIGFDMWTGGGMTATAFAEQLRGYKGKSIRLNVDSEGGDVFDAFTIYNLLSQHDGPVKVDVLGLAASAASFIIQAADEGQLRMAEASMMMVHDAGSVVMGNAEDMRAMADVLEKLDGQIATIYAGRSGRRADTFRKLMDAESWFTAQEAVDHKLADAVIPGGRVEACAGGRCGTAFRNMPERARAFFDWTPVAKPHACKCHENENPMNDMGCVCNNCDYEWDATTEPSKCPNCGSTDIECGMDDTAKDARRKAKDARKVDAFVVGEVISSL